jgi:hypothetical protein
MWVEDYGDAVAHTRDTTFAPQTPFVCSRLLIWHQVGERFRDEVELGAVALARTAAAARSVNEKQLANDDRLNTAIVDEYF